MRKVFLAIMLTIGTMSAHAYDYGFLTFESTDGTTVSLSVESLRLTFNNGQLVAANNDGSQSFSLSQLSKMFFSANNINGISQSLSDNDQVEVFTIGGMSLGSFKNIETAKNRLKAGFYIVKSGNTSIKIAVK